MRALLHIGRGLELVERGLLDLGADAGAFRITLTDPRAWDAIRSGVRGDLPFMIAHAPDLDKPASWLGTIDGVEFHRDW